MNHRAASAFLLSLVTTALLAQTPPAGSDFTDGTLVPFDEPLATAVQKVRGPMIAAHLELLASPAMEGRGLDSRGLDAATGYAAAVLRLAGIQPYGDADGSWYQRVPLRKIAGTTGTVEIERKQGELTATHVFANGVDALFAAIPPQTLRAPVVFAGYGIREQKLAWDDYAGLDVRGRVVMIVAGLPSGAAWQNDAMRERYGSRSTRERFAAKLELARSLGAAAVLAIEDEGFGASMAENVADEARAFLAYDHEPGHEAPALIRVSRSVACAVIGEDALDAVLKGEARRPAPSGAVATIRVGGTETLTVSRNVLGILPGSDPKFRDEAVVLGAHIDHLGIVNGVLHPGADDNASGTAALLEIAKTFAALETKPKRTLIFAFWTGEEEGRFGSDYYVAHPRWPLARTVANVNLDMIAHPWLPAEIRKLVADNNVPDAESYLAKALPGIFVEPGLPRGVPALEEAVRRSAAGNGLAMHLDWTDGKHGGSDYRGFARRGIPFLRFFGNFHPDYHKPGDTADRLDPAQIERVARFAFAAAWQLANP